MKRGLDAFVKSLSPIQPAQFKQAGMNLKFSLSIIFLHVKGKHSISISDN